ncbi:MAG: PqiC family protein [Thermodesulfobacteriota bacterium]
MRIIIILVLVMALGFGCSSVPPMRFYALNPLDPGSSPVAPTPPKTSLSIEVGSLRLPQYLERPQIVTRRSASRLEVEEFHQWGGNLRKDMMRVLAKNLSQLLGTPRVFISPHSGQAPPDFRVELEVMKFERDPDGKVRLSVQWSLTVPRDQRLLLAQMTELESPSVTVGPDMETTVTTMSMLWGEMSRLIAETIWKHAPGRPVP